MPKEELLSFPTVIQKLTANDKDFTKIKFSSISGFLNDEISDAQTDQLVSALGTNKFLKEIDFFSAVSISNENFEKIVIAINNHPAVKVVIINEANRAIIKILTIRLTKPMQILDLYGYDDGDKETFEAFIASCKTLFLEELSMQGVAVSFNLPILLEWLKQPDCSLQALSLDFCQIGDEGASSLAEVLNINTSLKSLRLLGNRISEPGAASLALALKTNTTLTTLDLGQNWINYWGGKKLAEALKSNVTLRELILDHNDLGSSIRFFTQMLSVNISLKKLSMQSIGLKTASSLFQILKENKTSLKSLNLSGNLISSALSAKYAKALETNTTLEEFLFNSIETFGHLHRTNETTINLKAFGTMLKKNKTLKNLELGKNFIHDQDLRLFSDGLRQNITLLGLNLEHNKINSEGGKELAEALDKPSQLQRLNLEGNPIKDAGLNALHKLIQHNPSITTYNFDIPLTQRKKFAKIEKKNEAYRQRYRDVFFPKLIQDKTEMVLDVCKLIKDYHEFESYTLERELLEPKRKIASEDKSSKRQKLISQDGPITSTNQYFLRPRNKSKLDQQTKADLPVPSSSKKQRVK